MKLSERLEALVRNACPAWHAAETIREAADLARRFEDALESDAALAAQPGGSDNDR